MILKSLEFNQAQEAFVDDLLREAKKNAELELLNWAMKCCSSGYTPAMIRKIFYNKFVEISGEGQKA